jgi:phage shock protein PspC (stress-responsive transcriptional regulator)
MCVGAVLSDADLMSDNTAPQPQPQPAFAGPTAQPRRLTRVREGKLFAGVTTGLARYLDVDPIAVRIGFVVATIFSGAGILLYLACWILMPQE